MKGKKHVVSLMSSLKKSVHTAIQEIYSQVTLLDVSSSTLLITLRADY